MKLFVVFALALATASAAFLPAETPVHPRDLPPVENPEGRITYGQTARPGQFPYQVGLSFSGSKGGWWCGGSLISNTYVLTAAHCTDGASFATVYLGSTERTNPKVKHTVSSSKFKQHANYNSKTLNNDISLINIPSVSFSSDINKIELPKISSSYSTYSGQKAIASGWGRIRDSVTSVTSQLQYAVLEVIENSACAKVYGSTTVTSKTICTATPNKVSTCSGDSGGPLVLQSNKKLIGVTSFVAKAGCESGKPAGFVRVTGYLDWIKQYSGVYY